MTVELPTESTDSSDDLTPTVQFEWVSPEKAALWLERNFDNRKLSPSRIKNLAREVARTGPRIIPDCMAFDINGTLINGQHRLTVIAQGTDPWYVGVMRNLPTDTWDSTDRVKPRHLNDALRKRGESNETGLAAAIRLLYQYEQTADMAFNSGGPASKYVESELLDFFYNQRIELRESVRNWDVMRLSRSFISVVHYCIKTGHSLADADEFLDQLKNPHDLEANSPIYVLRQRLGKDIELRLSGNQSKQLPERVRRAIVIIAFNKWINGETASMLKWKPGGADKDWFPKLAGYPHFRA